MRRAAVRSGVVLFSILAVVAAKPPFAHELGERVIRSGSWHATLLSAHGLIPGVRVALLPGRVPGLFLESSRSDPIVILGRSGEPFLRFSAGGVEANLRSPLWRENALARGERAVGAADPKAAPAWRHVSHAPRLGWLEFRAWPGADEPSAEALGRSVVSPRLAWTVPIRFGDRSISLLGLTTWQPSTPRRSRPLAP